MCRSKKTLIAISPEQTVIDLTPGDNTNRHTVTSSTSSKTTGRKFNFFKSCFPKKNSTTAPTSNVPINNVTVHPETNSNNFAAPVIVSSLCCLPTHARVMSNATSNSDTRSIDALLSPTDPRRSASGSLHSVSLFSPSPEQNKPQKTRWCFSFGKRKAN